MQSLQNNNETSFIRMNGVAVGQFIGYYKGKAILITDPGGL
jgi:hypothetical protein